MRKRKPRRVDEERLNADISIDLKRRFQAAAVLAGKSLKELLVEAMEEKLERMEKSVDKFALAV